MYKNLTAPTQEQLFTLAVQTGIPVLLNGNPGEAKTAYINALSEETGRHSETIIASTRDPSDFGGLPHDGGAEGIVYSPPSWVKRINKAKEQGKLGMVFFDEITCAPPSSQAALLRVIHEKVVGDTPLPKETWMVAAMNPPEIAANGFEISPPMANRFIHIEWQVDTNLWIQGMLSGFKTPAVEPLPENWRKNIPQQRSLVASFIKARPQALRAFPKDEDQQSKAWPSPRTWDLAAMASAAFVSLGYTPLSVISALVGDSAATEFVNYVNNLDLPDPEELLANPKKHHLPKDQATLFATLSSVTAAVMNNNTPERFANVWIILGRVIDDDQPDVAIPAASTLVSLISPGVTAFPPEMKKFIPLLKSAGLVQI